MTRTAIRRLALGLVLLCIALGAVSQERSESASQDKSAQSSAPQQAKPPAGENQVANPNSAVGRELAETSNEAAGEEPKEENAEFKYSKTVRWIARHLGLSEHQMYWVSLAINFGLLALFFYMLLRTKLPQAFRERTAAIQKGIREAQAASAEASARLSAIEARLAKLDTEVTEIRTSAERDAAAEEERIRQAAEEDKHKVVEGAEAEIAAIARNARRELKSYAATLAVDLAGRKIHLDESTDRGLVREFTNQLGKDGK